MHKTWKFLSIEANDAENVSLVLFHREQKKISFLFLSHLHETVYLAILIIAEQHAQCVHTIFMIRQFYNVTINYLFDLLAWNTDMFVLNDIHTYYKKTNISIRIKKTQAMRSENFIHWST